MPLTIASVLGFIPTNIWRPLKKFLTKDDLIIFDLPFKLSTKYTPALLIVMMCLSFANQFVRNVEIDCSTSGGGVPGGGGRGGYGAGGGGGDSELNDFCWNYETFLVAKALEPGMRGSVTYPGVSGYIKDKDELFRQRYYKQVWLILGKLACLAFLPFFLWKFRGIGKMKSLIEVSATEDATEDDQRVFYYLETVGFNGSFAYSYLGCKLFAAATPFFQWYYLTGFLGRLYKFYGVDVLVNFMDDTDPWPNPMDALFPKMAKCEWSKYGYGGDIETKSAQCQLPMNNLTQWSFFIYWWWISLIFVVNVLSCLRLLILLFPCYRRFQYRKFVERACREDVEKARTYTVRSRGEMVTKMHSKKKVIIVNLSFGDWLVLSFLKKNLADWQFRDFIRKMAVTENIVLQLRPMPSVVDCDEEDRSDDNGKGGKWHQGLNEGFEGNLGNKAANMEMGFINMLKDGQPPPTYSACETVSTDCELNPDEISPTPSSNGSVLDSSEAMLMGTGNNDLSLLCNQQTINISPPVKIDRINLSKKTSHKKDGKKGSKPDPVRNHGYRTSTPIRNSQLSQQLSQLPQHSQQIPIPMQMQIQMQMQNRVMGMGRDNRPESWET